MTKTRSMTDVAYDIMLEQKNAIPFKKLWEEVIADLKLEPETASEKIAQFYTDMTLDSRFTSLKENKWDLRERHRFEEVYVDLGNFDEDEDKEESELDEEELEGENIHKVDEDEEY